MNDKDAQEVQSLREIIIDPKCCDERMAKLVVGHLVGKPRYQYACRKCGAQKAGQNV